MRPRREQVEAGVESSYHCISRIVRGAFLLEFDHAGSASRTAWRKPWLERRLCELATIFAIDVDTFAIMDNHLHLLLTIRPAVAQAWTSHEVAERWLRLYPPRSRNGCRRDATVEEIDALSTNADRIARLRERLCCLSRFHKVLKQPLAWLVNRQERRRGHLWDGRFRCQRVLDEAAFLAVMAYIDLNPVRAQVVEEPEEARHTGLWHRAREFRKTRLNNGRGGRGAGGGRSGRRKRSTTVNQTAARAMADKAGPSSFLTPIGTAPGRRRILPQLTTAEYLTFVDRVGRLIRRGKRGRIPASLPPILDRLGQDARTFLDEVASTRSWFGSVVGTLQSCVAEASRCGRHSVVSTLRLG